MRFRNIDFHSFTDMAKDKRIILFGAGLLLKNYSEVLISDEIVGNVAYIVDNHSREETVTLKGKEMKIFPSAHLAGEQNCIILIISAIYGYEIYQQLQEMNLPDAILCYSLPLIMAVTVGKEAESLKRAVFYGHKAEKIDKIIHSFWFSGEKKPDLYQKCLDSWKKYCPDYEIHEWNMDNYDYQKNRFMYQAIREKKWAFAADYARLDMVGEFGGIYLDMDVELIASPEPLLQHHAFFTFDTNNDVELAAFGAERGNKLVKILLELYRDVDFCTPEGRCDVNNFCQPRYIREKVAAFGIKLDGSLQCQDGMVFLPRKYLVPLDNVVYLRTALAEDTIAIHHTLAGWKEDGYRKQRIENNRKLLVIANQNLS